MIVAGSIELKINYYAMAVAILAECSVETAFEKLQCAYPGKVRSCHTLTPEDTEDMRKLKAEGVTWKELGEIYCVPLTTPCGRLKPRRKKVKLIASKSKTTV